MHGRPELLPVIRPPPPIFACLACIDGGRIGSTLQYIDGGRIGSTLQYIDGGRIGGTLQYIDGGAYWQYFTVYRWGGVLAVLYSI